MHVRMITIIGVPVRIITKVTTVAISVMMVALVDDDIRSKSLTHGSMVTCSDSTV